ncbi:MAG: antitoxin [Deltaproteobacteria bacterium]|nr:antitoxin [Deltaproteobacteria bacterium]
MKKAKLSRDERDILKSFEQGEWKSVKDLDAEKKKAIEVARATFRKDRRVNIRISTKDLEDIRKKAVEEGIPYQTLIASVLHKYVAGRLKEKGA